MEQIKATIPTHLRNRIVESKTEHVPSTCAHLVAHLASNPIFPQLLQQLTDPEVTCCSKDADAALRWKMDGNSAVRCKDFEKALSCYSKALQYLPLALERKGGEATAILFVNRAFSLHKLGMMEAAERDCARAIELHPLYSKAWYRRGHVRAELLDYKGAHSDMEKALAYESSASRKNEVKKELLLLKEKLNGTAKSEDPQVAKVSVVLIAAMQVILKEHRKTHCHFCFRLLPADQIPCKGCTTPLYCSESCRDCAMSTTTTRRSAERTNEKSQSFLNPKGGKGVPAYTNMHGVLDSIDNMYGEHNHECGGASWPAVLPSEAVLAARMFVQSIWVTASSAVRASKTLCDELEKLCHHYEKLSPSDKLEVHVLAVVIAHCLQPRLYELKFDIPSLGSLSAKLVLLISQVRANAMAIVNLTSPEYNENVDLHEPSSEKSSEDHGAPISMTCSIEHVKVAQAIFLQGSLFNHSCIPNAHASFVSRHLYIHSTKPIIADSPVELCYGAEAGETGRLERQNWLKERYFFDCQCWACSEGNLADMYMSAYHCHDFGCDGVVPADNFISKMSPGIKEIGHGSLISKEILEDSARLDSEKVGSMDDTACCMNCGLVMDRKLYHTVLITSLNNLKRASVPFMKHSPEMFELEIALEMANAALKNLRSVLHRFNRLLAEAEDIVAQLFCAMRQPQNALQHCGNSIKILEKLYGEDHIVVANERMKLATIAFAADDLEQAQNNLEIVKHVYGTYYGPNFRTRFPFMVKVLTSCAS
ncbi:hypothetical protein O6H91_02G033600 [Diphasiastrum complanatum]|uniref:Uncharacterized protein n=1 Tax=Diphasiastrum complanatum TaxID=34168 RepID=A0ACC2EEG1_DIPCM|nr:hypothetical protein O6H91_02G033600 [Diphasiastrum complanatum]